MDNIKLPWFRLFPADIESDAIRMTPQECRAYLILICQAWQREGKLPIAKKDLARIALSTPSTIDSLLNNYGHLFIWGDDFLRLQIVEKELQHSRVAKAKRTSAAKVAAAARWGGRVEIKGGDDD